MFFSASSVKDIYYLVKRHSGSIAQAHAAVIHLSSLVQICDTAARDIQAALEFKMADFEDAVLAAAAQREKANFIITRNVKDFANSPVPAITPKEFISKIKNKLNTDY